MNKRSNRIGVVKILFYVGILLVVVEIVLIVIAALNESEYARLIRIIGLVAIPTIIFLFVLPGIVKNRKSEPRCLVAKLDYGMLKARCEEFLRHPDKEFYVEEGEMEDILFFRGWRAGSTKINQGIISIIIMYFHSTYDGTAADSVLSKLLERSSDELIAKDADTQTQIIYCGNEISNTMMELLKKPFADDPVSGGARGMASAWASLISVVDLTAREIYVQDVSSPLSELRYYDAFATLKEIISPFIKD